ncbi:BatD family protein [Leyella stercorea]|uniref:BatD family protein n=1 Tax=Leyella stercorea TaxID=363265 RepID=UPI0024305203|nr:BatD family protein [Leyella stercorea]
MNKKITTLLLTCFAYVLSVCAQNISVSAPTHVATGENFRVSYTIANVSVDEFRSASIPSGLEVIAGPYTSQQSSYQIVNGHTSRSSSITYTYTLYAEKAGSYTIGAAHAKAGGKTIASRPFRIQVSGATRNNGSSAPNMHDDAVSPSHSSGGRISSEDLFVKVTANKKHVHEQEPILLTYKVYTLVDLTSLDGKMPDLKGFHTQEIPLPQQKSFHIEKLNGRNYRCVTWSQYVMYPQMTGKMTIPSLTFKGVVVMQNRNVDPFEAFFNGGSGYIEVKRNIVAPAIDIRVDPLPQKPADFSGGVGRFSISSQLLNNTVKAGAPVTLRVVVGGNGNLKLIKQPVVTFPKDFDKYDPKVTDKTKLTTNGLEGNMVYDFLVVPRNHGNYTIPAVSLTYYDTSSNLYKTVKTAPLTIKVEPGDGKGTSVTDYSAVQQTDIKPIKQGGYDTIDTEKLFFGSTSFLLWLLLPFVLFVALVAIFHKKAVENADIVGKRGKRANKVATKRLKTAYKLLTAGKQNEFYDEVLRALWGYVGDKLNMPVEQLSRENISDQLAAHNINAEIIEKFISALDECEYERYAPGSAEGNMTKTYDSAMIAITEIDGVLRDKMVKRNSGDTVRIILLFVVLCLSGFVNASVDTAKSQQGDSSETAAAAYVKGDYQQAAECYTKLLKVGESAELYYNLGNCEYRLGNITQSIIAYEHALRLNPGDSDTRYNLQFLRGKTIDKVVPVDEMFFVTWYHSLQNLMSIDAWAILAVSAFVLALILILVYLFGSNILLRKIGFFGALVGLLIFVLGLLFAYQRKVALSEHNIAIVLTPTLNVKATPAESSSDAFVIHEGTRLTITDSSMNAWYGVRLDDGKEGWLPKNSVEVI